MTIDISAVQVFTDEDQLILVNKAIADSLAGGASMSVTNRSRTMTPMSDLLALRAELEARINASNSANHSNIALAKFGDRV